MGSVTDWSVRSSKLTTIIARPSSRIPEAGTSAVFAAAVDASTVAKKAVKTCLTLMKPNDKLLILHVRMDDVDYNVHTLKDRYEVIIEKAMIQGCIQVQDK